MQVFWDYDRIRRYVFAPLVNALCAFDVQGADKLPDGGFIFASNHLSFLDPIALSVWSPIQISFGAKAELFMVAGLRTLMVRTEQIPLKREGMTRAEFRELVRLAKSRMDLGGIFGLFPEGTRSRDGRLLDFEGGVVLIAAETKRPIVPVGLAYRFSWRKLRPRIRIRIGEPLDSSGRSMRDLKQELERQVASLSGQERAFKRRVKKQCLPKAA